MTSKLLILAAWTLAASAAEAPWTLERAIAQALANNPDARLAVHRIASARAGLAEANAGFWPQLKFQSSYGWTDNPMRVFGAALNQRSFGPELNFNDVPDADNLNLEGMVTVPLYTGGRTRAGRQAAQSRTEAARYQAEAVNQALAFEVVRAFHSIHKAGEFIRATEAAVRAFENHLTVARRRQDAGTLLKSDVLDIEVRLAQAREDGVRARHSRLLTERALRNLLAVEEAQFSISEETPTVTAPESTDFTARPELGALQQQELAAKAGVRAARSGYVPTVSAFGALDYDRGWHFNGDDHSYAGGLLLQWNLWDGQLTRAKVTEARVQAETVQEELRKARLAMDLEVERARLAWREAQERLGVTAKMVVQAEESAQLVRARFEQGLAIPTQLIDAEVALTTARVRRAEAEADLRIAVAAWRKALGRPQIDNLAALSPTK